MNTTAHATWKYPVAGLGGVLHAMNPNPYRGIFGNDGPKYAAEVQDMIQNGTCGRVAGTTGTTTSSQWRRGSGTGSRWRR